MLVTFYIPSYLREFTDKVDKVKLDTQASNVFEALEALWKRHPGVRSRIVTEQGDLRLHVNVFVGNESIRNTGGLQTKLEQESDISIVPSVSGG